VIRLKVKDRLNVKALGRTIRSQMRKALAQVAKETKALWKKEAQTNLKTLAKPYSQSITLTKVNADKYELTLKHPDRKMNWLINALENGMPSFDIKPGLLKGKASKRYSSFAKKHGGKRQDGHAVRKGNKKATPFVDIFTKGRGFTKISSKFVRVSPTTTGWIHPGFRPTGKKGMKEALRVKVARQMQARIAQIAQPFVQKINTEGAARLQQV
jgi:hypothetical protein